MPDIHWLWRRAPGDSRSKDRLRGNIGWQYRILPEDRTTYVKWLRWGTETISRNVFEIYAGAGAL